MITLCDFGGFVPISVICLASLTLLFLTRPNLLLRHCCLLHFNNLLCKLTESEVIQLLKDFVILLLQYLFDQFLSATEFQIDHLVATIKRQIINVRWCPRYYLTLLTFTLVRLDWQICWDLVLEFCIHLSDKITQSPRKVNALNSSLLFLIGAVDKNDFRWAASKIFFIYYLWIIVRFCYTLILIRFSTITQLDESVHIEVVEVEQRLSRFTKLWLVDLELDLGSGFGWNTVKIPGGKVSIRGMCIF